MNLLFVYMRNFILQRALFYFFSLYHIFKK